MEYFKVFIFLLTALVAVTIVHAQNNTGGQNSVVTDGEITENEKSSLEKGMDGIFKLYQNFLETVMPYSFYDSDTPFNVNELNKIVKNNDYDELNGKWQDLVKTYGGVAACIICGFIFVVFMPIAGLIYCCCHCCCNNCGGTKKQNDPKRAACMRATFAGILLVFATLALVGCIITFIGSELLKKSLKNEDNEGLLSTVDTNIGRLQTFANSTLMDVKTQAKEKIIVEGLDKILPTVENAVNTTVEKIKDNINATQLLSQTESLGQDAKNTFAEINNTRKALDELGTLQTSITTKLNDIKADIDTACNGISDCPDTSGLQFQPDFTGLDNLTSQLNEVTNAQQIDTYVQQARDEFNAVSRDIDKEINSTIEEARTQITKIKTDVNTNIESLDGKADPFIKDIQRGRDFVNDEQDLFTDIGNYTWYACIGLGCSVLLVVLFYYMGILFGLCGERPGYNANCCNRGTGANLLCAGVFFSFLFAAILMLVVIIMFSVGGVGYIMSCRYINDGVENVQVFESVLSDGFEFNISKAFNVTDLTISGMFQDCKDNKGVYTALHLQSIFDIDKEFNTSEVEKQVRDMTNNSFIVPDITLLSNDLRTQLQAYANTGLSDVNFTSFTEQLNKPLTSVDIDSVIQDLRSAATTAASLPGGQPQKAALEKAADDLEALKTNEIADVDTEKTKLSRAVTNLQTQATRTSDSVKSLIDNIQRSQDKFNLEKEDLTKQGVADAVDETLNLINTTVSGVKNTIKNDIGRCRPLYIAVQNVADAVCLSTLDPFNAIWFGLGWSLFFYIPCIIFAAILSNLYQRTNKYEAKDKFDEPNFPGYAGYDGGRSDDVMPLTNQGESRARSNGSYNAGYNDYNEQVPESRYHRDGNYRDSYMGGRDRDRPVYDRPVTNQRPKHSQYDSPPHYDEAVGRGYGQQNHGGYPKAYRY